MLNQIYESFETFNLNPSTLLISVVVFSLLWALAAREMLSWFMKTNEISKQFKNLHKRLDQIENKIQGLKSERGANGTLDANYDSSEIQVPPLATKKSFEFRH
jgi:hypothetical protein